MDKKYLVEIRRWEPLQPTPVPLKEAEQLRRELMNQGRSPYDVRVVEVK